jgi:outer membrane protein W
MKSFVIVLFICLFISASSNAQGFSAGQLLIGPSIGYGLGFGAGLNGEYAVQDNIGIGVDLAYEGFTQTGSDNTIYGYNYSWTWDYKLFGLLVFASYHFPTGNSFDPFIKAGFGYFNWNATYSDNQGSTISLSGPGYSSGIGYTAQAGFHYYVSPYTALRLAAGYPFYISGGIDFVL